MMIPSDKFAVTLDDSELLKNPYEIHCKRCGRCCTEMMLRVPFPAHATAEEHLKARSDAERFYRLHGFDVLPSMAGEIVLRIPAICEHLVFNGQDTTCNIHETRPEVCRKFLCPKCRGD